MDAKRLSWGGLRVLLILMLAASAGAVDTGPIKRVREKSVLETSDFEIIDTFIREAVDELVSNRDFTSVERLRRVIVNNRGEQEQYALQYSKSCSKYITQAFADSASIEPPSAKLSVRLNLMILVDNLEDPALVGLALEALSDKNTAVRYWAVHALTRPALRRKLTSPESGNPDIANRITEELDKRIETAGPQILLLIADYAGQVNTEETEALLLRIADLRIDKYANWTAQAHFLDTEVLKLICDKLTGEGMNKAALGRRFAQLYSYVMQKYLRDLKDGNFLSDSERQRLVSILVEIENKCIGRLTGFEQQAIKTAIENQDYDALLYEHNRLLGDASQEGIIPKKFYFDYGQAGGVERTWPLELPERPKESKSSAGELPQGQ